MAKYFRLGKAPSLVICPPSKPQIAITRLASQTGLPDQTASIPREKSIRGIRTSDTCMRRRVRNLGG